MKKQTFKNWLAESVQDEMFIVYNKPTIVYHTTSQSAADKIKSSGFQTGHSTNIAEKRKAIYFAAKSVNPELYARNKPGEQYAGEQATSVPVDISGLTLLNMGYKENGEFVNYKKYNNLVVRGELDQIPFDIDGTISFLEDGRIYEVALKSEIANQLLNK